jgi:hypothetical protein
MEAGVLAAADPAVTARIIWANVHGWVSLELMEIGEAVEDQEAGFDRSCASLLTGLRP